METSSRKTYNRNDKDAKAIIGVGEGRFVVDAKPSFTKLRASSG